MPGIRLDDLHATSMNTESLRAKLRRELQSFSNLWHGGYYEGNPLDPVGASGYGTLGYLSTLYATYLVCIKPYIDENSVVCEIGPGRGAWTKTFLKAKEVWCLDALSAEHNKFWEYVGPREHVKYFQVKDFSCDILPEDTFSYLFSFGCFCHISFDGIAEYMTNLYPKLKQGAHCFIMVADYDKYNEAIRRHSEWSILNAIPSRSGKFLAYLSRTYRKYRKRPVFLANKNEDDNPRPGRWYHAGTDSTCEMLQKLSYKVIERDMNVNLRDPVIHVVKP